MTQKTPKCKAIFADNQEDVTDMMMMNVIYFLKQTEHGIVNTVMTNETPWICIEQTKLHIHLP